MELEYGYRKARYWTDDASPAEDDFHGDEVIIGYFYNFTPHTTGSLGYTFSTRYFDGATEDYKVHEGLLGFEHAFSPAYSVSAGAGYFVQDRADSSEEDGFVFNFLLSKTHERGSIEMGGDGGYDQAALDPRDTGFTRFWRVETSADYQVMEPLTAYATGSFRHDKEDDTNRNYDIIRGTCGLRWTFLRWFTLSLDYSYSERDDDLAIESYTDNRVSLTLMASRLYRW